MKLPKYFYKLSLYEQDTFLSIKLQEIHAMEDKIRGMLKTVRGGLRYEAATDERPDLEAMKIDKEDG